MHECFDLGDLIDWFAGTPIGDRRVLFDFARQVPLGFHSYRGFYEHLTIGFSDERVVTSEEFLAGLQGALATSFWGYKGGMYHMTRETPVWVANPGYTTDSAIIDINVEEDEIILYTGYRPW